ncbi:MAG TPA: hypothetical protein EYG52_05020 [Pseudomonadales bacterium]|nr:hypothetical protein [Gammaproteobacteria bacterium]HIL82860.1 hypothetical protein [Pseudomonadales bacterium]
MSNNLPGDMGAKFHILLIFRKLFIFPQFWDSDTCQST